MQLTPAGTQHKNQEIFLADSKGFTGAQVASKKAPAVSHSHHLILRPSQIAYVPAGV